MDELGPWDCLMALLRSALFARLEGNLLVATVSSQVRRRIL